MVTKDDGDHEDGECEEDDDNECDSFLSIQSDDDGDHEDGECEEDDDNECDSFLSIQSDDDGDKEDGECEEDDVDVCNNIDGVQLQVPDGMYALDSACFELETFALIMPSVSFTQIACEADGSYTLGSPTPGDADKLLWTVNGVPNVPSGTYYVDTTMNVTVDPLAIEPDGLEEWDNPSPLSFTVPAGCDLVTLALTAQARRRTVP